MMGRDWRHLMALTMVVVVMVTAPSHAVKYKGNVLCRKLVEIEDFVHCHDDKVSVCVMGGDQVCKTQELLIVKSKAWLN